LMARHTVREWTHHKERSKGMRTGSVELNEDVLVALDDQLLKGVADEDGDGAVVGLRRLLRLGVHAKDTREQAERPKLGFTWGTDASEELLSAP
jgi:hypothetical protein